MSSLCHQEFWVHHMVELLPSAPATGQRTPAHRKEKGKILSVGKLRRPRPEDSDQSMSRGSRVSGSHRTSQTSATQKRQSRDTVGKTIAFPREPISSQEQTCTVFILAEMMPDDVISLLGELLSICEVT